MFICATPRTSSAAACSPCLPLSLPCPAPGIRYGKNPWDPQLETKSVELTNCNPADDNQRWRAYRNGSLQNLGRPYTLAACSWLPVSKAPVFWYIELRSDTNCILSNLLLVP